MTERAQETTPAARAAGGSAVTADEREAYPGRYTNERGVMRLMERSTKA